jgi:hypothetical protein
MQLLRSCVLTPFCSCLIMVPMTAEQETKGLMLIFRQLLSLDALVCVALVAVLFLMSTRIVAVRSCGLKLGTTNARVSMGFL